MVMTKSRVNHVLMSRQGFGLIEVMLAMVVLSFAILGVMASFQWADHGVRASVQGTQALALAQARIEAKRAGRWNRLLLDDLDGDGVAEVVMRDDGQYPDATPGDGLYTAAIEQAGVKLTWTLRAEPVGSLMDAGLVSVDVRAEYQAAPGRWRQIRLGALRGNPGYLGTG
jgi:prepilin-type N-terminal cleavage/methylation domain-containing protein